MNKCEGAFSLQRSVLSTAERAVRFVSVQKEGLSQLPCVESRTAWPGRAVLLSLEGEQRFCQLPPPPRASLGTSG